MPAPLLASLGATAATGLLNNWLAGRSAKQAERKQKRADAFSGLVGSLNPGAQQGQSAAVPQRPSLAQGVAGSDELRQLLEQLLSSQGRQDLSKSVRGL